MARRDWRVKRPFKLNGAEAMHLKRACEHSINHIRAMDVSEREHGVTEKAAWAAEIIELREEITAFINSNWPGLTD